MPERLEKLTIKDFRGATKPLDIDFDKSKPMVMIFGENGTGKSSIVDAFDFICNQKYGSIEDRSSIKRKSHLPAIGKNKNDICVTLKYNSKDWTAGHQGTEPVTTPDGVPAANILRRSNILKIIDAQPNQRYENLAKFLSVPNIEKCEGTLRDAVRNQERECNDSFNAVQQAKDELENLQNELKETDKPVEEWSKEVTEIDETELKRIIKNSDEIQTLQDQYNKAKEQLVEANLEFEKKVKTEKDTKDELKAIQEKESVKEDLQKLLETAKTYFTNNDDIPKCPVCEQSIQSRNILERLTSRLADMTSLTEKMKAVEKATKNKQTAEQLVDTRKEDYKTRASELVKKIQELQGNDKTILKDDIDFDKLIEELTTSGEKEVETAKIELAKYEKYKTALADQKAAAEKKQQQQAAVKSLLESIKQKEEKNKKDNAILARLREYEEILPKERKQYTDSILYTVSSEVERLYQAIHPNEGLGGIRLYLKPNVRGSLEYDGTFQDSQGIPPQAYYSDAHLDTLGICMFLALAKHFNDDNTIVVLDDVVTSADESHRERFLNLLHDEAENFCHLVVTTHYRPWRDFYRIGGGPSGKVQFIDLQLWSKEAGIRHYKSRLIIDELKLLKDNITIENRQNIASKSGILLEAILDQIALRYGLKVPRKPVQQYELGILFDSLSKAKKHLKTVQNNDDSTKTEHNIEPLIENLAKMTFIRNQVGSHWNLDGSLLSDSEVKNFAENTISLCEALSCKYCGNLPVRDKTGNCWQCQCGKLELYPHQMP